jgi:hypothetical protein
MVINQLQRALIVLANLCLAACEPSVHHPQKPEVEQADDSGTFLYTTRAYTGTCVFSPQQEEQALLPALAAAVLPSLIRTSLGALQGALLEASDRDDLTITSTVNTEFGGESRLLPCIQFVRGWMYTTKFNDNALAPNIFGISDTNQAALINQALSDAGIYLVEGPDFFLEIALHVSEDTSALSFTPLALFYRRNLGSQTFRRSGEARDLAMTLAIGEPGSAGDDGMGVVATLRLEKVPPIDRVYKFVDQDNIHSGPSSPWVTFDTPDANSPRYFALSLTETTDANQFFKFLHDVLEGAKDSLADTLDMNLIPSKIAEAERTADDLALTALTEAITKQKTALTSYNAFVDKRDSGVGPADLVNEAGSALAAIYEANLAAKRSGRERPFDGNTIQELEDVLREASR